MLGRIRLPRVGESLKMDVAAGRDVTAKLKSSACADFGLLE